MTAAQESKGRLFLIDGTALAYRSHFAFQQRPLTDKQGRNVSALFGFFSTLFAVMEREKPEMMAIAFDTKAPTFRHDVYPEYKATRQKMPEDMAEQLPILRQMVIDSGITMLEEEGLEADDLIGSAAKDAERAGYEVYMVTGDKDFFQLVSDKVKFYNLKKGANDPEVMGPAEVKVKFGVPPEQVIEVLGLMGDTSDNIPGVRGVGPKTAVNLITKYGSIKGVYEHVDEVKGAMQGKLRDNEESAFFSRELVTIKTDCPIEFDAEGWRVKLNDDKLRKYFEEFEFFHLMNHLKEEESDEDQLDLDYITIDTAEKLDELVKTLSEAEEFAFDTETTSEDPMKAQLVGLSFGVKEYCAYYVPCNKFDLKGRKVEDKFQWFGEDAGEEVSFILGKLRAVLEDADKPKTAQNAKYDMTVLKNYGVEVRGVNFDTMLAHYLVDPAGRGHGLDALSLKYLRVKKVPTSELIGSGSKQITMDLVDVDKVAYYACEDADCTNRLKGILAKEVEDAGAQKLLDEIEIPLIEVLMTMEMNGVALDVKLLNNMSEDIAGDLVEIEKDIYRLAGQEFNIASPKQLSEILFEKLNLPVIRKTKTGYSTDEGVLQKLAPMDPLPAEILKYRGLAKLKNTYTDALPKMVNPHTGRVHTSYNQTVAATGRLSSTDPNLQNIPVRTDTGGMIRQAFIPLKPGWKLLAADYSQIELRVLAHLSKDPGFIEAFARGEDIHRKTAALVFNSPPELVTDDMRRSAKEVNFGVIYGMREFGLSERLGIPRKRAKEFIDSYFQSYPKILEFVENTINFVKEKGYAETMMGRRRPLPEINSKNFNVRSNAERIAVNAPIQGSAADMIKVAMIRVHERMVREQVKSMMIMQVHDELVFEVPEEEFEVMEKLVVEEMEGAMPLDVPVKVDASYGDDWLEAH
ncbi:MAG: DNA polymerase I [FCB group bacterium]|nr:DNA polymerase I [FCB group bacterium]